MSLQRKNTAIKGKSQNKGPHVGVYLFCLEMRKEFKVAEKGGIVTDEARRVNRNPNLFQ